MKIAIVHNAYGKYSGEEAVVNAQRELLIEHGHKVCIFERSSGEIQRMFLGRLRAFLSGIFSLSSRRQFKRFLTDEGPDLIHIHNLYPLISPSILPIANEAGVPVVMTVHNYRLVCPNGLFYTRGEICMRCEGGREYWCVVRNCEKGIFKSIGYAVRNWWSRKQRYFFANVSVYACLTCFQRDNLVKAGVEIGRVNVLPNMLGHTEALVSEDLGEFVGFSGRLTLEKGIEVLVEVARRNVDIDFCAAGSYDSMADIVHELPDNFELLGHCNPDDLKIFYKKARFIVLPSVWFEGFPMVLLEAMAMGKAVICSDIGGLSEIVDDGVTGLLATPGDAADLSEKIRLLWNQPSLCRDYGIAGRKKVLTDYSKKEYYDRLTTSYQKAIDLCVK